MPLRVGRAVVGVLNIESERALPDGAARLLEPLASALAPLAEELRRGRMLDLPALARLFVHLGSIRDPDEIAALGAASLPRVLPVEVSQVVVWDELGSPAELASWSAEGASAGAAHPRRARGGASARRPDRRLRDPRARQGSDRRSVATGSLVWLPLRANGTELGALVAIGRAGERVDPVQLDGAALLAAHVAASLDAAVSLPARAPERRHRPADGDPQSPRARGATRPRARDRAGATRCR